MTNILFHDIDEPGLDTHRRSTSGAAATRRSRKALEHGARATCSHELKASGLRGRGGAGFPMGVKAVVPAQGRRCDKYLVCNADESEPGTFKDRELMQKNPHQLDRGHRHRGVRGRATKRVHLHPRRVRAAGRHPRRGDRGGPRGRLPRRAHPRLRPPLDVVVHRGAGAYICGEETGAARLARGQARQPAPEAAVPGHPGPLPGPDADQQRRDAGDRAAIIEHGRRGTRRSAPRSPPARSSCSVSRQRAAPGQLRDRARHALARDHLRPRRRPARGPRGQALVPGRLERRRC